MADRYKHIDNESWNAGQMSGDEMFDGETRSNVGLTNLTPMAEKKLKEFEDQMEKMQGEKIILLAYSEDKDFNDVAERGRER